MMTSSGALGMSIAFKMLVSRVAVAILVSPDKPKRWALSLTCSMDSSPVIYKQSLLLAVSEAHA